MVQPYIMKTYFGLANPPVNIAKFAIGDGTVGSGLTFEYVPTVSTIPLTCLSFPGTVVGRD